MVPNGWKQVDLGSLFDFKNGLNTDKEHYGSGYKFVNVMDVFSNDILTEDKIIGRVQVSDNQIVGYQLQYGDVLFNRTSETFDEIAMAAVYLDDAVATFGGFVIRGRPKSNDIYPVYSAFLFQAESYRTQAIKLGQGAVRANIGQKDLAKVNVLLPSIEEQNKIAQILSTWDQAISVTKKLLKNSQQQKKALMQQLLTGKKRLLDENGVRFSDTWSSKSLKDISKVSIGLVTTMTEHYVESGIPLIRNSDIKENRITKEKLIKLSEDFANQNSGRKLSKGDVVTVHTGEVGVSAVIDDELDGCLGFATLNTRPNTKIIDAQFLCWYFNSSRFIAHCISLSTGDGRQNLNLKDFNKVMIPVPSLLEQKKIANVLSLADQEIEKLKNRIDCLKQEKKALMQQLLTGKKRVKVAA